MIPLSLPGVAIFESSHGPAVSVPSWNTPTHSLHPVSFSSTWWERRQRTFLHSWVLDAALITTPETETWSCSCRLLASAPVSVFVSICLFARIRFFFFPETERCLTQRSRLHAGIVGWAKLASRRISVYLARASSAVTSTHPRHPWVNIPITSQRRPVSIHAAPRPSSSRGSPEAAH